MARAIARYVAIADNQQRRAFPDRRLGFGKQPFQAPLQRFAGVFFVHVEKRIERYNFKILAFDALQPFDVLVGQHRMRQFELTAVFRRFFEQIPLLARKCHQRHHQSFSQRVNRRIGDLGKKLLEISE